MPLHHFLLVNIGLLFYEKIIFLILQAVQLNSKNLQMKKSLVRLTPGADATKKLTPSLGIPY